MIAAAILCLLLLLVLALQALPASRRVKVDAGTDKTISTLSTDLEATVVNLAPLEYWTADGNRATEDQLIKFDSRTGVKFVGPLKDPDGRIYGWPGDFQQIGNRIYGVDTNNRTLYTLDGERGICNPLATRFRYSRVMSLAFDSDQNRLFAVDQATRKLLLLNSATGAAREVLTLPQEHSKVQGLAYRTMDRSLYYSDDSTESIYRLDVLSGKSELFITLSDGPDSWIEELEFYQGRLFAAVGQINNETNISSMQILELDVGFTRKIGEPLLDVSAHCLMILSLPESVFWRKLNGPGGVEFAKPHEPRTQVTFSKPGTYILEVRAGKAADRVTVAVQPSF